MNGKASFPRSVVYDEDAFHYLLENESRRSERSGICYQVLLVYRIDAHGVILEMDPDVAGIVIATLARNLRETDYIGWYRKGRVLGGVLTVVGRDSLTDAASRLQPRLLETLRVELGDGESGGVRIRVYQHHEIARAELDGELSLSQ